MPVKKVKGGYKWGDSGKVYKNRADAEKQGRAIKASQARRGERAKSGYKWDDKQRDTARLLRVGN